MTEEFVDRDASADRDFLWVWALVVRLFAAMLIAFAIAVVLIVIYARGARPTVAAPAFTFLVIGVGVVLVIVSYVLPSLLDEGTLKRSKPLKGTISSAKLAGIYFVKMVLRYGALVLVVLLGAVAYVEEGYLWALFPCAVGLALMGLHFPTEGRLTRWVAAHRRPA